MANTLAKTTFVAGPQDNMAAVDVYSATGTKVINSILALTTSAGLDLPGLLGTKSASSIASVLSTKNGKLSINTDALTARLVGINSGVKSAFSNLSSGVKTTLTSPFSDSGSVIAKVNGISTQVSSSNITDLNSFGTFLNNYTSQSSSNSLYSINDEDGMACIIGGMVTEGSNLGVPNVYSTVTAGQTSTTLLNKIVSASVPSLVANSDIDSLSDMAATQGSVMGALFPNLTKMLVQGYNQALLGFAKNPQAEFTKLTTLFTSINATWNQLALTPTTTITDLTALAGASPALQTLVRLGCSDLLSTDGHRYLALAAEYPPTTVVAEIKKYFPMVVLTTNISQAPNRTVINPIVNNLLGSYIRASLPNLTIG